MTSCAAFFACLVDSVSFIHSARCSTAQHSTRNDLHVRTHQGSCVMDCAHGTQFHALINVKLCFFFFLVLFLNLNTQHALSLSLSLCLSLKKPIFVKRIYNSLVFNNSKRKDSWSCSCTRHIVPSGRSHLSVHRSVHVHLSLGFLNFKYKENDRAPMCDARTAHVRTHTQTQQTPFEKVCFRPILVLRSARKSGVSARVIN